MFINADQYDKYNSAIGNRVTLVKVNKPGIVYARHFMQIFARDHGIDNYFMFDDDLERFQYQDRISEDGKFFHLKNLPFEDSKKYLEEMEKICLDQHKIFVGLCPRRMGWKTDGGTFFRSLPYEFEWVNNKWYIENDAYVPLDLYRFEDTWMGLVTIAQTGSIDHCQTYKKLVVSMKSTNFQGGCSETIYKNVQASEDAFNAFPRYFPTLRLKPKIRYSKDGWKNYAFGIDWKNPLKKVDEPVKKVTVFGQKNIKTGIEKPKIQEEIPWYEQDTF